MEDFSKEIQDHVSAIGKWASEDENRVAFVVLGGFSKDGVQCCNTLVGRTDKIARTLYGSHKESEDYKHVLDLAAKMTENPIIASLIEAGLHKYSSETESHDSDSLKEILARLLGKLADSPGGKK